MTKAITYVFIFAVAVGLRLYWLEQKQGLHTDEMWSFRIAGVQPEWIHVPDSFEGRTLSGAEVKQQLLAPSAGLGRSLYELRRDNNDHNQTNLFYSLLRIATNGNGDHSLRGIKLRAGALNLCLFSVTFVLLALLLRRLFGSTLLVALGLAVATLTPLGVSNAILFRPYELQELSFVAFALMYVSLLRRPQFTRRSLWLVASVTAFCLLSAYASLIFVGLLFAVLAFVWWCQGLRRTPLFWLVEAGAVALLIASTVYPNYLPGIGGDRQSSAAQSISLVPIAAMCAGAVLLWTLRRRLTPALVLIGASLVWAVVVWHIAPFRDVRYIAAGCPLVALAVPALVSLARNKALRCALSAVAVALICLSLMLRPAYVYADAQTTFPSADRLTIVSEHHSTFLVNEWAMNIPDSVSVTFLPMERIDEAADDVVMLCTYGPHYQEMSRSLASRYANGEQYRSSFRCYRRR